MEDCTWNKTCCLRKQQRYTLLPFRLSSFCQFITVAEAKNGLELWHKRLGHMSQKGLDILLSSQKLVTEGNKLDFCNDYRYGKQVKSSYSTGSSRKTTPLELIHSDFCTMPTISLESSLHFVTFIDDYSRMCSAYLLKDKAEVFAVFRNFHAFITTQTGLKLKF